MVIERFSPFLFKIVSSILCGTVIVLYLYLTLKIWNLQKFSAILVILDLLSNKNNWLLLIGVTFFIGELFICMWEMLVTNHLFGVEILDKIGEKESMEPVFKFGFILMLCFPLLGWVLSLLLWIVKRLKWSTEQETKHNFRSGFTLFLISRIKRILFKGLSWLTRKILEKIIDRKKIKNVNLIFSAKDLLQFIEKKERSFAFSELYYNLHRFWGGIACFFGGPSIVLCIVFWKHTSFKDEILWSVLFSYLIYLLGFWFSIFYRELSNLFIIKAKESDNEKIDISCE